MRHPITLTDFLAWEERQELRYEFDGFQPVGMTGGTIAHDQITFNLRKALDARLGTGRCRPFGPNVKIIVAGRARYPDAVVTCSPVDPAATVIDNPVVVFEVISTDTARTDRIEKLREYQATQSIQRYLILEQKSAAASIYARRDQHWIADTAIEGEILRFPELGIDIPLIELYAGLTLEPQA